MGTNLLRRARTWIGAVTLGLVLGVTLGVGTGVLAQGPYTAQIQALLNSVNVWTGLQTFPGGITVTGTCTGCGGGGGGAPTDATYVTQTANASLSAEQAMGALGTGLVKNATTTGVQSIYAGAACTNQFVRALDASAAATCASVANADLAGSIAASKLVGSDIATVGTITAGVWTGTDIAFANVAQGTALSVLGVTGNATADVASIAAGTDHQVLRRSGTALAFGALNLAQAAAVTGVLPGVNFATGTPDGSKFLRDDQTWQAIPGGGDALTSNPLSQFASTTSAQLATVLSNETGTGVFVLATSPALTTPDLGTPSAIVLTNATGTAASLTAGVASAVAVGGITGLGTGVATALAVNTGSAGAPVLFNGAGGTPSSIVLTNATGTAASLTAGTASAVAIGGVTGLGTGVATALAVNVGSAGAPVLFNGALGTPSSGTLTSATGLPIATGVSGLGTGIATALAVNTGSAGAPVLFNGAGGTPTSIVLTNATGTAASLTAGTASAVAVGGITGLGTGIGTWLATPSSANLLAAITNETGTGLAMFSTGPTFTSATAVNFGAAGVSLTDDGDGALTFKSLSAGSAEDLTLNLDDTANTVVWASSTGANIWTITNLNRLNLVATAADTNLDIYMTSIGTGETNFYLQVDAGTVQMGLTGAKAMFWENAISYSFTPGPVQARFVANGNTPAVTDTSANSCGTGTQTIVGNDNAGKVTVIGSAGTSCTVTFTTAFVAAPSCSVSNETTANLSRATTTTSTVILAGVFAQNDVLAYVCLGR